MTTYSGKDFWLRHRPRWPLAPLKAVAQLGTGHTPSRSHPEYWEDCTVPWVTTDDLTSRTDGGLQPLRDTRQKISELGIANSAAVLHPANTVMLSRTASIGHSVRIGKPMATTQAFVTWTCGPLLDSRYLLLVMNALKPEFDRIAYGSTHLTIYFPDIEQLRVPVPPVAEQQAIADYLDTETTRIDALIAKKRRLCQDLDERFRLIAFNTTTSNGPLLPLRRCVAAVKTGTTPPAAEIESLHGTDEAWYSPGDVGGRLALNAPARMLNDRSVCEGWVPRFEADSTLIIGIGATAGRVAHLSHPATGNQQMTCLVTGQLMRSRFLSWQLWARTEELRATAPYTTLPILNNDFLRSFELVVPDLWTQDVAVAHLDHIAGATAVAVAAIEHQVELLIEHRQALITAAVTGELSVPGVAA